MKLLEQKRPKQLYSIPTYTNLVSEQILHVSLLFFLSCLISNIEILLKLYWEGRVCIDQIFAVWKICEKYLTVNWAREVCMAFMDLEKAYDRIDRNALLQVRRIYGTVI